MLHTSLLLRVPLFVPSIGLFAVADRQLVRAGDEEVDGIVDSTYDADVYDASDDDDTLVSGEELEAVLQVYSKTRLPEAHALQA